MLWNMKWVSCALAYRKVASTSPSRLEAHPGFFRLSMKGKFYVFLLWPFGKATVFIPQLWSKYLQFLVLPWQPNLPKKQKSTRFILVFIAFGIYNFELSKSVRVGIEHHSILVPVQTWYFDNGFEGQMHWVRIIYKVNCKIVIGSPL